MQSTTRSRSLNTRTKLKRVLARFCLCSGAGHGEIVSSMSNTAVTKAPKTKAKPNGSRFRADSMEGIRSPSVDDVELDPVMTSSEMPESISTAIVSEVTPLDNAVPEQSLSVDIPDECPVAYVALTPIDAPASPWRLPLVSSPGGTAIPRAASARSTPTRVPRSLFAKTATADAQTDDNTVTDTNESADDSTITQSTTIQQTPTRIPPPPARFLLAPASPAQPRDYYTAGTTYSAGTTAGSARIEVVTPNNFFHAMPTMAAQEQPTNTIDSTHTTLDLPTNEAPINEAPTNEAPALLQGDQSLGVDHQLLMDTQSSESDWLTTMSAGVVVDKEEETAVVEDNVMIMEDNTFMGELDTIIEENTVMGELDAIIADNTIIEDNTTQQPKNSPVVVGFDISNTTLMANNPATLLPALPLSPVPESMEVTRHGGRSLAAMGNAVGDAATPVLISKDLQQMSEQGVEDLPVLMQLTDGNWTTPSVSNTSITSDIFVMDDLGTPLQALVQAVSKM